MSHIRRNTSLLALVAGSFLVVSPERADAQLTVCNRTADQVSVAVGFLNNGEWESHGWYNAPAGECVTPLSGALPNRTYYVRAEGQGISWGNDATFCVRSTAFAFAGRACGSDSRSAPFVRVDVGWRTSYTLTLNPAPATGTALRSAVNEIRVNWRESLTREGTWVMMLSNDASYNVAFTLRCYTRDGGMTKSFSMSVAPKGSSELGYMQGWDGNFVRGEYCDAYSGGDFVWRATALNSRAAK